MKAKQCFVLRALKMQSFAIMSRLLNIEESSLGFVLDVVHISASFGMVCMLDGLFDKIIFVNPALGLVVTE